MAFDSIDKIFNDIFKRFGKLFDQDRLGNSPDFKEADVGKEGESDEFEQEEKSDGQDDKNKLEMANRKLGFEIISGSDMKDPIVRIYGDPDEFPELKGKLEEFMKHSLGSFLDNQGLPMPSGEPGELEAPALITGESPMKEPFSESFKEKDGSTIVNVDLPGVKESDVSVDVDGKTLHVEAHGEKRHYLKNIELERKAASEALNWRLNNGVLEIKIRAAVS
jgi:HSP20 family molecular chaperone IbpA